MHGNGKWALWVALIAAAVALVVFAPGRPDLDKIVDPAPWSPAAPTAENSKPAVPVQPGSSEFSTVPIAAADAAPPEVAPASSRPVPVEYPPNAADTARLEIDAPSQAVVGRTIDILFSVAPGTTASKAEIVVLFDPSALQLISGGGAEPGRAEATIQSAINGGELGSAVFRFLIIASYPQGTIVTATATAFDASGGAVNVIVPPPQEIALDRPPS